MFYLQLRNERWKLFGKKRTYIGFGMIVLCQLAVALAFRYTHAIDRMIRTLEGNGYLAWFLTYHLNTWQYLFNESIPWWRIAQSLSILFGFNLTFFLAGYTVFQMRDIKL